MLDTNKEYYVYALIDPTDNGIFYIGKGKGNRAKQHLNEKIVDGKGNRDKIKRIRSIIDSGNDVSIEYIIENLEEEAALFLEEILIDRIGRKVFNYGTLTNLTIGGVKDNELMLTLEENEKVKVEDAINKYPNLKNAIDRFPRTTQEDKIKSDNLNNVKTVVNLIKENYQTFFNDIEAHDINILKGPFDKGIQFDCKFGRCQVYLNQIKENFIESITTIIIRKNGDILFRTKSYSDMTSAFSKFYQFYNENE